MPTDRPGPPRVGHPLPRPTPSPVPSAESSEAEPIRGLGRLRGLLKVLATAPAAGGGPDAVLSEALPAVEADAGALVRRWGGESAEVLAVQGMSRAAALDLAVRPPVPEPGRADPDGPVQSVVLPLRVGDDGRGVLVLRWNRPRALDPHDRTLLDVLADLVAVGLDAASLRERADRLVGIVQARQSTHEFLAALFADAPVGFALLDTDLRFVMVNKTLADINGVPVAEHVGRTVEEILPDLDLSASQALRRVLVTGEPLRNVEVSGRTPASPEYKTWLEDFYQVRTGDGEVLGVAVILSDVTAQRRSERRLGQLIDSLASFVGLCLPDGTLIEANRAALEAGGLTLSDVVGRELWDTPWTNWSPESSATFREAVEQARTGRTVRFDVEVMMADGPMTIDFRLMPLVENDEVVALVPSGTDITDRRRSVDQATGLAALARRLNAASTVAEVADTIRESTAPAIGGRHATLALLDTAEPGVIRLLQSPTVPEHVARQYQALPLDGPSHISRCVRTGTTVAVADPLTLDEVGGDVGELERLRRGRADAGVKVTVATPLSGKDGVVLGALALGWPEVTDFDEERRARMSTVAELCAQAIERARLTDAHVVAAERSRALSALASELASTVTVDEVWAAVARGGPAVVGARVASLGVLDHNTATLEVRFPSQLPAELTRDWRRQSLTARRPQTDAARTGEPIYLASRAEHEQHYPGLLGSLGIRDDISTAVLPLRDSADRVIGTLSFSWDAGVRFDALIRSTLETITELCGQTLERARLHAAEHELVEGLQRRLLRPMPVMDGLSAHAVYRAAQTSVGIGGDFHDGLVLPGERLAVVLGDVAGHGMEAAADMAQLRTLLSTLLAAGIGLDRLFPQADAALGQVTALSLATAVAAVVDPSARTLSYVHAGHPPLVLHTPDGLTAPLADARGGLLGIGIAEAAPRTVGFEPGAVLVGYTDGLVEIPGRAVDQGIEALVDATAEAVAAAPDLDAAGIAAGVLARCVGDRQLTDDVALLVVSYPIR